MTGPLGLHGGHEYRPGDEPYLALLLGAASIPAAERAARCGPGTAEDGTAQDAIRIAIVPTAAAGERPDLAGRTGREAFERVAEEAGRRVRVEVVPVVDAPSSDDARLAGRLAGADLVHLPGGDPAVIPAVLPGTLAWRSIVAARARGAVVAGASAGAMALAEWAWTPDGPVRGLGLLAGLVVVPHFEHVSDERWRAELAARAADFGDAASIGILGLDEQTGILSGGIEHDGRTRFRVAGRGRAVWHGAAGGEPPSVARDGETIAIPIRQVPGAG